MVVGGEYTIKNSGDLLQKELARFAPLPTSLDAWLLHIDVEDEAVLPEHYIVQGMTGNGNVFKKSGDGCR
jgi:hypothetical protein